MTPPPPDELRDPAAARAYLEAGVLLARTTARCEPALAARALVALLTEAGALPPPGFVLDLAAVARGATLDARAPSPSDPALGRAVQSYEHLVLSRLSADPRLRDAGDALARLPDALVPSAMALLAARVTARLGIAGVTMAPAAVRALARMTTDDGLAALRDEGRTAAELRRGYEELVRGARGVRALVQDDDVFVLLHLDVLESLAQRVGMAQVLEAEAALGAGLPKRAPRRRARGVVRTALQEEDTYPVGGFSSITNTGTLENLVTSELVYMDDDPTLDLFDLRYASGELLYYTRDEATFVRTRRAVDFVVDGSLADARARDPELPWQRSIAALAMAHAAVVRLAAWLGEEDLAIRVLFPDRLGEEQALMTLLLREQIERGVAEVLGGEASDSTAHLQQAALRGVAQQVLFGGAALPARGVEVHALDVGRGTLDAFRARLAALMKALPLRPLPDHREPRRDALQDASLEHAGQPQAVQVHVPDVAAARRVGARSLPQRSGKVVLVQVPDRVSHEVTASHHALAVHREHAGAGAARLPLALVIPQIDRKERVERGEPRDVHLVVRLGRRGALHRVDPEIHVLRQLRAQRLGLAREPPEADDPAGDAHACVAELAHPGDEPSARHPRRVIRRPQRQPGPVRLLHEAQRRRQVRLDGHAIHVRDVRQLDQGIPIALSHQRLAPRREEDPIPVIVPCGDAGDESA